MENNLAGYLLGYELVELSGGSPQWAINRLTEARIPIWNLQWIDALQVRLCIFHRDWQQVQKLAEEKMCQVKQVKQRGFFRTWGGLLHRPILVGMVLLSLVSVLVLPRFLWFFTVTGNREVPSAQILRELENLDMGIGIYGPKINPKWIKDHLLYALPKLQWVTVTQNGCMAQVVVRERPKTEAPIDRRGCADVLAARSGLITEQSILAGQALHQVGDIVLEGERLVSGLVNLETTYAIEYAQAEIFARTWRNLQVQTPSYCLQKRLTGEKLQSFWLEIGHRRIKIFGNSGIYRGDCDKMISRKLLSLPGGWTLPVAWVVETCRCYEPIVRPLEPWWVQSMLEDALRQQTLQQMQAGEILQTDLHLSRRRDCFLLQGTLECREMIARTVETNWNEEDFKDD